MRVSLDRADDLGNRFAGALISGPLAIEDPVDRVAAVRGEVLGSHWHGLLENDGFRRMLLRRAAGAARRRTPPYRVKTRAHYLCAPAWRC